jgi:glc operon protein GlcG
MVMKTLMAYSAVVLLAATTLSAQQAPAGGRGRGAAQTPPPPAPAAGSAAIYKSGDELAATLKRAMATAGDDQSSANITTNNQYRASIVHREKPAGALAHAGNTEMHYILEGTGTVVTGGTIVRGAAGAPATIQGGETKQVKKGDVIIVPENSPHWYKEVTSPITYLEVRWVAPAAHH